MIYSYELNPLSNTHKVGYDILLQIIFSQHSRDEVLFNNIKKTLGCGNIIKYYNKNIIDLAIFIIILLFYLNNIILEESKF